MEIGYGNLALNEDSLDALIHGVTGQVIGHVQIRQYSISVFVGHIFEPISLVCNAGIDNIDTVRVATERDMEDM